MTDTLSNDKVHSPCLFRSAQKENCCSSIATVGHGSYGNAYSMFCLLCGSYQWRVCGVSVRVAVGD